MQRDGGTTNIYLCTLKIENKQYYTRFFSLLFRRISARIRIPTCFFFLLSKESSALGQLVFRSFFSYIVVVVVVKDLSQSSFGIL